MKNLALSLCLAALAAPAAATDLTGPMQAYFESTLHPLAHDPIVLSAVRAQNGVTEGLTQADIDARDSDWAAQLGSSSTPLIDAVLNNDAANHLREVVAASGGRVTEIIVMDSRGLNVAVTTPTSDYWQGDEAKYQETYLNGAEALHMSDIELDESTGRYQAQISFTVSDEASGEVLGAITVGVDAELL
ncbi:hypothetical protein LCM17_03860 [Cereibacter sphaeroides]|nr:hypothetical protein [Cereibacter sphaeroides]